MKVQPYLYFDGRCEEAIEFYKTAIGATVEFMMRFKESPEPHPGGIPAGCENKVMHSSLRIGDTVVMASDGHCKGNPVFNGITLTIVVATEAEANHCFTRLSAGGKVNMPLTKTFYSPRFGMVTDRFGVSWMVIVQA
jgi:PhnB protein